MRVETGTGGSETSCLGSVPFPVSFADSVADCREILSRQDARVRNRKLVS